MAKQERGKKKRGAAGHHRKFGEDFLLGNRSKDGVTELPSGIQYKVLDESSGRNPGLYDNVIIHQRAMLLDGKILEDTYKQNQPVEVKIEELIEGLREGLQLMKVGGRYKFWIPPELGWGRKGSSQKIPPFAVLTFDIRLIEIL